MVTISAGHVQKAVLKTPVLTAVFARPHSVTWRVPRSLKPGVLTVCVVATDPSGHRALPPAPS